MRDFIITNKETGIEHKGQFDDKGSEKYPYVIFNHNGMIGTKNPSELDSDILNKLLMKNKDNSNCKITYNQFIIKIK